MYSSVVWNPASSLFAAVEVYSHFLSGFCRGSPPVSRCATWSWNTPKALPMRGVSTQFYEPKSNTACTTALKKNMETRGSSPYLLRILVILFHTALSLETFLTTSGQSLSAANITLPRYQKEITISRGTP